MRSYVPVLILAVFVLIVDGQPLEHGKLRSLCEELCSNCGGDAIFVEDVCKCRMPHNQPSAWTSQCLVNAGVRAKELDFGWHVDITQGLNSVLANGEKFQERLPVRRVLRSSLPFDNYYNYYKPPVVPLATFYQGEDYAMPQMYDLTLGDSEEHAVQLVFPDSNGLEVEHQYLMRDSEGVDHSISSSWEDSRDGFDDDLSWSEEYKRDSWESDSSNESEEHV